MDSRVAIAPAAAATQSSGTVTLKLSAPRQKLLHATSGWRAVTLILLVFDTCGGVKGSTMPPVWLRLTHLFGLPDKTCRIDDIICASIGPILRADAKELVRETLPPQFLKLLRKLERRDQKSSDPLRARIVPAAAVLSIDIAGQSDKRDAVFHLNGDAGAPTPSKSRTKPRLTRAGSVVRHNASGRHIRSRVAMGSATKAVRTTAPRQLPPAP
jgi:hypothetical protein